MLLIIVLSVLVLLTVFLFTYKPKRASDQGAWDPDKDLKNDEPQENFEDIDYNEAFYQKNAGKETVQLVRTYSTYDKMFLRMLLKNAGVESYCKNESTNQIYGGVMIDGLSDAILEICVDDKELAVYVTKDYLEDSAKNLTYGTQLGSVVSFAVTDLTMPKTNNRILPVLLIDE